MQRSEVLALINTEREYQGKWGTDFDDKNTINDWVTYIIKYLGSAITFAGTTSTGDEAAFRKHMVKVAALAVAVLERDDYAPRHYDTPGFYTPAQKA